MLTLEKLEQRIHKIEQRNNRVENDKSWETSFTRKILLIIFTYFSVGLYLNAIQVERPWINAIVPALGFLLSTLTLSFFRRLWEKYLYRKRN